MPVELHPDQKKISSSNKKKRFVMVIFNLGLERNASTDQHVNYADNLDCNPNSMQPLCQKLNLQSSTNKSSHTAVNTNNLFKVYHQNIRGLKEKVNKLTSLLFL
jgi:glyceraldehyde-3-phosphate dehydrogenase/erythrose-4-phosphate dehydrogenase